MQDRIHRISKTISVLRVTKKRAFVIRWSRRKLLHLYSTLSGTHKIERLMASDILSRLSV